MSSDPAALRYWPFATVVPAFDRTEHHREYITFMELAHVEGHQPRADQSESPEAGDPQRRYVFLCRRGRYNGWEPFLVEKEERTALGPRFGLAESACVCVRPPFRAAARLALQWLRGPPLDVILEDFEFVGGFPAGLTLRPGIDSPFV
jgi:hypothetical protein